MIKNLFNRSITWFVLALCCSTLLLVGGKLALFGIIGYLMCGIQSAYLMALNK